jgi:hypothetical protein
MAYWPGAGGRRSREVAAGRCRSVGAETGVGEKEAKAGSQKDLEAGQRMTEKRSLSAEVAIEAKKPRKKTGRGVRARLKWLKVRVLLRSLAVRAESLTGKSLQRKRMGRRFALKVKRRRRRRSKERKSRSKGRKGKERIKR